MPSLTEVIFQTENPPLTLLYWGPKQTKDAFEPDSESVLDTYSSVSKPAAGQRQLFLIRTPWNNRFFTSALLHQLKNNFINWHDKIIQVEHSNYLYFLVQLTHIVVL